MFAPFEMQFMQYAMLASVVVAAPMGVLSCYLVMRGWSLMGDAIAHAVLPGVVLAYAFGAPLVLGAFVAGMLCSAGVGYVQANSRIKEDTAMGVIFSGMFGLGLVLYTKIESGIHLDHILFGDALGISKALLWQIIAISGFVSLLLVMFQRYFTLQLFDPVQAQAVGLKVNFLHYGLLAILSLCIVSALNAVGIIMAIALLIAPGATAFLMGLKFQAMLIAGPLLAASASLLGVYLSYFIDSSPAPTIVMVLLLQFSLALISDQWRQYRLRQRQFQLA